MIKGTVVKSIAGHDKESLFVVVGNDGEFVLVADGKHRKLLKPKKKNSKHLKITDKFIDVESLLSDKQLRKLINLYIKGGCDLG